MFAIFKLDNQQGKQMGLRLGGSNGRDQYRRTTNGSNTPEEIAKIEREFQFRADTTGRRIEGDFGLMSTLSKQVKFVRDQYQQLMPQSIVEMTQLKVDLGCS